MKCITCKYLEVLNGLHPRCQITQIDIVPGFMQKSRKREPGFDHCHDAEVKLKELNAKEGD